MTRWVKEQYTKRKEDDRKMSKATYFLEEGTGAEIN